TRWPLRKRDEIGEWTGQVTFAAEQPHCPILYEHDRSVRSVGHLVYLEQGPSGAWAVAVVHDRFELDERNRFSGSWASDYCTDAVGTPLTFRDAVLSEVSLTASPGMIVAAPVRVTVGDIREGKGGYSHGITLRHRHTLDRAGDHLRRHRSQQWVACVA